MLNANLENYKILGAREVPEIEVELVRITSHRARPTRRESGNRLALSRSLQPSAMRSITQQEFACERFP